MRLLLLAGGFGTRLRSEIGSKQKVMAPVNGVPFLRYQIENWLNFGIKSFTFLLHYKSDQVIDFLNDNKNRSLFKSCSVTWQVEEYPLGTGGAIRRAIENEKIEDEFLVANADTWLKVSISELIKMPGNIVGIVQVADQSRFGSVYISERGVITEFKEKNPVLKGGWINSGLYKFQKSEFEQMENITFSLEKHFLPKLIKNRQLHAAKLKGHFCDIGVPEDYKYLQSFLSQSEAKK